MAYGKWQMTHSHSLGEKKNLNPRARTRLIHSNFGAPFLGFCGILCFFVYKTHPIYKMVDAHIRLYRFLESRKADDENVFCSTASLQIALCAAVLAATPESDTQRQLLSLFAPYADAVTAVREARIEGSTAFVSASALFTVLEDAVRPAFAALLKDELDACALHASSAKDVNDWCARATRDQIRNIINDDAVNEDTVMIIVNAVLFRATWQTPFEPHLTREGAWRASIGASQTRLPFMNGLFMAAAGEIHAHSTSARAVRLPYNEDGGQFEAWFVLPTLEGQEALAAVGAALPDLWADIAALPVREDVFVRCPRFTVDSGAVDITKALRDAGITEPFIGCGGFDTATAIRDTRIKAIVHRATCTVAETGTIAAAASAVVFERECCFVRPPPFEVLLERPFFMAIVAQKAGRALPLFLGRIMQPQAAPIEAVAARRPEDPLMLIL